MWHNSAMLSKIDVRLRLEELKMESFRKDARIRQLQDELELLKKDAKIRQLRQELEQSEPSH
jgi:hypothetical protein